MNERHTSRDHDVTPHADARPAPTETSEVKPNYPLRRRVVAGAGVLAALGIGFGANTLYEGFKKTEIAEVTLGIESHPIGTVSEAANYLAEQNDIDPLTIAGRVAAGQEVSGELKALPGRTSREIQPGEMITVKLERTGFGRLSVSADPADVNNVGDIGQFTQE
ncbi:MAG: hypothetical protein ABIR91_00085 [Candidatus Saccharimonadales bacterium]